MTSANTTLFDDPPLTAPPTYAGWYRASRASPWRQLVTGETYDATWGKLLDKVAELSQRGGKSTVVAGDANPNRGASIRQTQRAAR